MSAAEFQTTLDLGDREAVADLRTFLARARAVDPAGAVRLQAVGRVLAAYVCVLAPRVLGEATPTVLGMRAIPLAEPSDVDVTVSLSSVFDRLARMGDDDAILDVPPSSVHVAWAAVSPPRGPWAPAGDVPGDVLAAAAADGMAKVASLVPEQPGQAMVDGARASVWGNEVDGVEGVPAGAAFAAEALGFLVPGGTMRRFAAGPWVRLSSPRGHVLCRVPRARAAKFGS
ncbi:hypothetical protein SPF06_11225 [Sinomonas sp. JGH33]|uniref:Uncharacterized protein n=1 Tax=Sinomonas terricola TaxID=3110330 RepID=A0ABU5T753_9MICC|nr:hypothetical protein [Sinomonas sp. JGH33]MEA5455291.1 hypothetical protein [Sinomonas sp. JGH33]